MVVTLRVLSLGAGVQSTALALLAAEGRLPKPDFAIFADTGWEPRAVYEHLERLKQALPYEVVVVNNGNIYDDLWARARGEQRRTPSVPLYTLTADGKRGILPRQCTEHYKLAPILRELRARLKPREVAELWLGITTDEAARMRPARVKYVHNRWPLIELDMSRADCIAYLQRVGWHNVPKSACIGCPYRSTASWREMRDGLPDEFAQAVALDAALRDSPGPGITAQGFLHRFVKPLPEAVEESDPKAQRSLFMEDCEGMCGT